MGATFAKARVAWMRDPRSELFDISDPVVIGRDPDVDAPGAVLTALGDDAPVVLEDDPHRAYADWTPFEDAFIRLESRRSRPVGEMAAALKRTPGAVSLRLRKLALT
jgi:hypothetical protein